MNRKNIVAGNWKMNKDYKDGMELISEAVNMIRDERNTDTIAI
jgi:triosephosphate isomerase